MKWSAVAVLVLCTVVCGGWAADHQYCVVGAGPGGKGPPLAILLTVVPPCCCRTADGLFLAICTKRLYHIRQELNYRLLSCSY